MMPGRYGLVGFVLSVYLGVSKMMSGETATNMDEVLWKGRGRLSLYRNGNVPPSVKSVQSHQEDRGSFREILQACGSIGVSLLDTSILSSMVCGMACFGAPSPIQGNAARGLEPDGPYCICLW